jgi:hypothetical protein
MKYMLSLEYLRFHFRRKQKFISKKAHTAPDVTSAGGARELKEIIDRFNKTYRFKSDEM